LPDEDVHVPATDRRDVHEAVIVDVLHDDADLVDVTIQQDRGAPAWIDLGHAVARNVGYDIVRKGFGLRTPHPTRQGLESRRPGGVQEAFKEGDRIGFQHGRSV
jgi:hypothetical protein